MSATDNATAPPADPLAFLESRRSVPFTDLGAPGPDPVQLERLLAAAARTPDHALLVPWRFILLEGEARGQAGARLATAYRLAHPDMEEARREKFAAIMGRLFTHAPVVVVVVSRPDRATRIPVFEQELSAGAVCMNLLHAIHAQGFSGTWVTGWAATHPLALAVLGVAAGEQVAGLVHIGTARQTPAERPRPDLAALVRRWSPTGA